MPTATQLPTVVRAEWQVDQGLRAIGLTREIVRQIAYAAAGARADAMEVDPSCAPGMLSYIFGVRHIRLLLKPLGWRISRVGNVESTVNDAIGVQLCFQNVDIACGADDPEAISGKGAAARQLVKSGQGELFPVAPRKPIAAIGSTPTVWVLCVSADEYSVRAEVSCPEAFEGNQFDGFVHRLCVIDDTFEPQPTDRRQPDDLDGFDFDIAVTKK